MVLCQWNLTSHSIFWELKFCYTQYHVITYKGIIYKKTQLTILKPETKRTLQINHKLKQEEIKKRNKNFTDNAEKKNSEV